MVAPEPERMSPAEASAPEPAPETFTADELLSIIRKACIHRDPDNAAAYRQMEAAHVREAVRLSTRLLDLHREYVRVFHITRRGRRRHAEAIYRLLDVAYPPYLVVAATWRRPRRFVPASPSLRQRSSP